MVYNSVFKNIIFMSLCRLEAAHCFAVCANYRAVKAYLGSLGMGACIAFCISHVCLYNIFYAFVRAVGNVVRNKSADVLVVFLTVIVVGVACAAFCAVWYSA